MEFVLEKVGVPEGIYRAFFVGAEPTEHPQYGPGLLFKWKVESGEFAGKIAARTTKPSGPTPGNMLGKLLAGLAGQRPADGLKVDIDRYKGKLYTIVVGPSKDGKSTRVDSVVPAKPDDPVPF